MTILVFGHSGQVATELRRQGEAAVFAAKGNSAVLRTSWVFSEHGQNFVKTMLRLAETPAVSWADFARAIFTGAGRSVSVEDIPTSAARPMNSRLDCTKITADFGIAAPDWRVALDIVLQNLGAKA